MITGRNRKHVSIMQCIRGRSQDFGEGGGQTKIEAAAGNEITSGVWG